MIGVQRLATRNNVNNLSRELTVFSLCALGSFAGPISMSLSHQRHHLPNNALNEIVGRLVVSYPDHRLSKLRNQDWNPPTHPCDHVCCIFPVFWRRNFRLHMFRGSAVRIIHYLKLQRSM